MRQVAFNPITFAANGIAFKLDSAFYKDTA